MLFRRRQFTDAFSAVARVQVTLDFSSAGQGVSRALTATVQGAKVGDIVIVTPALPAAGTITGVFSGTVTADDTVQVVWYNHSQAGTVDPPSQLYNVIVIKQGR